ncbi:hypothetical protein D3C80_2146380 [compost metagenome]
MPSHTVAQRHDRNAGNRHIRGAEEWNFWYFALNHLCENFASGGAIEPEPEIGAAVRVG